PAGTAWTPALTRTWRTKQTSSREVSRDRSSLPEVRDAVVLQRDPGVRRKQAHNESPHVLVVAGELGRPANCRPCNRVARSPQSTGRAAGMMPWPFNDPVATAAVIVLLALIPSRRSRRNDH